jgi:hypothetical protein
VCMGCMGFDHKLMEKNRWHATHHLEKMMNLAEKKIICFSKIIQEVVDAISPRGKKCKSRDLFEAYHRKARELLRTACLQVLCRIYRTALTSPLPAVCETIIEMLVWQRIQISFFFSLLCCSNMANCGFCVFFGYKFQFGVLYFISFCYFFFFHFALSSATHNAT